MMQDKQEFLDILEQPYDIDYEDPEVQKRLKSIKNFFDHYDLNYDEKADIPKLDLESKAYPNFESYFPVSSPRNTVKWLNAVKDIYYREKNGLGRYDALNQIIGKWDDMEKLDFSSWLKFYEEGTHLKYKTAQLYDGGGGYFLPIKKDPDFQAANDPEPGNISTSERKQIIEKQRQKIIGRLDSTEKLLRSDEGQLFAGKEFEILLEIIYQLKKKIQMVNKKSLSTVLYDDLIIREANILKKKGFDKASDFLYKLSQTPPPLPMPPSPSGVPLPTPPMPPTNVSGAPTTIPAAAVGNAPPDNNPPDVSKQKEPPPEGIKDFLNGLSGGNVSDEISKNDDQLEVCDADTDLFVEAQAMPPEPPPVSESAPVLESPPITEPELEVKEESPPASSPEATNKDFDNLIDAAFANLTVDDVVTKLEDLAKIFKNREIPRQLAIVDMMLDTLGLASFFPSLAEATNKSLESNQYVLTRVEDVLSKLRGTMAATNEVDLTPENVEKPEVAGLKQNLQEKSDKEKAKKQMRKDLDDKALQEQTKEIPEIEIEEDLGQPTNVVPTPPAPPPTPVR